MDSRTKIGAFPAGATVVRGIFDPMLAAHARALAELARPLVVQVVDCERPLLPLEARQLLAAALECVDGVIGPEVRVEGALVLDWTAEHRALQQEFIRHVHKRSGDA